MILITLTHKAVMWTSRGALPCPYSNCWPLLNIYQPCNNDFMGSLTEYLPRVEIKQNMSFLWSTNAVIPPKRRWHYIDLISINDTMMVFRSYNSIFQVLSGQFINFFYSFAFLLLYLTSFQNWFVVNFKTHLFIYILGMLP